MSGQVLGVVRSKAPSPPGPQLRPHEDWQPYEGDLFMGKISSDLNKRQLDASQSTKSAKRARMKHPMTETVWSQLIASSLNRSISWPQLRPQEDPMAAVAAILLRFPQSRQPFCSQRVVAVSRTKS